MVFTRRSESAQKFSTFYWEILQYIISLLGSTVKSTISICPPFIHDSFLLMKKTLCQLFVWRLTNLSCSSLAAFRIFSAEPRTLILSLTLKTQQNERSFSLWKGQQSSQKIKQNFSLTRSLTRIYEIATPWKRLSTPWKIGRERIYENVWFGKIKTRWSTTPMNLKTSNTQSGCEKSKRKTLKRFLRWYNNKDVIWTLQSKQKVDEFHQKRV